MATRTRRTKAAELNVDLEDLDTEQDTDLQELENEANDDSEHEPEVTKERKYFSHANCSHARKGEAGKKARAKCRRDIRAWLAAAEEYEAEQKAVAV